MGTRAKKSTTAKTVEVATEPIPGIAAFKGFNKDLACSPTGVPFQYAVGETYTMESAKLCNYGFHACTSPLDVFKYYPPRDGNRYAEVELRDTVTGDNQADSKIAAKSITVVREISMATLILKAVQAKVAEVKATTGNYAHSATTGNYAHSATTGYYAHSATTGYSAHSATTGESAHSATTGNYAHSATTGYSAHSAVGKTAVAVALGSETKVKGGEGSALVLTYKDESKRVRVAVAYVGENDIDVDTWYRITSAGEFVKA